MRKMATKTKPTIVVTKGDKENQFTITSKSTVKTDEITFVLGEELSIEDPGDNSKKKVNYRKGNFIAIAFGHS